MNIIEFDLPPKLKKVLSVLSSNNVNYYLFGGSVRDVFTEKIPNDYDFVAIGITKEELCQILNSNDIENYLVSSRKQVQGVSINGIHCEFACYQNRTDLIEYIKSLDFTCNSILLDLEDGTVIDVFNGCKDIADKRIKTVIPPEQCFRMNPFNMIRASYVAMNTGFSIDKETIEAIRNSDVSAFDDKYKLISTRIIGEILLSPQCKEGIKWLLKTGILEKEFPRLNKRVINDELNYDEIRYINETVPELAYDEEGVDYKSALLFMDVFCEEQENIGKFRFYDQQKRATSKLIKLGIQYYNSLGNLNFDDIEKILRERKIKPEHIKEILNLIAELKYIKDKFRKKGEHGEKDKLR